MRRRGAYRRDLAWALFFVGLFGYVLCLTSQRIELKAHNGRIVRVSDEKILAAQARLSRSAGLFTEPAGAAAFAGFLEVRSSLSADAVVVVLATGNGLKDTVSAGRSVAIPEKAITRLDEAEGS